MIFKTIARRNYHSFKKMNPKYRTINTNVSIFDGIGSKQIVSAVTVILSSSFVSFYGTAYGYEMYKNSVWYKNSFVDDEEN